MLPLIIVLLHQTQFNRYRVDVHIRLLMSTRPRVYLYGAIAYGTILNYALVCILAEFGLFALWYIRFGRWGFVGEFSLLLQFFVAIVPVVVGFPLLNFVEWLVIKWTRQGVFGKQVGASR